MISGKNRFEIYLNVSYNLVPKALLVRDIGISSLNPSGPNMLTKFAVHIFPSEIFCQQRLFKITLLSVNIIEAQVGTELYQNKEITIILNP